MGARNWEIDVDFTLASMPAELRHAFARGYTEAANGLPWARDYDRFPVDQQFFYEYGRLEAMNIRTAQMRPPKFSGRRSECCMVSIAIGRAIRTVGEAIPPEIRA